MPGSPKLLIAMLCACALSAVLSSASGAAASGARQVRLGAAPARPAGATVTGTLAPSTPMNLTVVLRPRDPAALQAYATAVSTPGSMYYRHFLTVAQFRARFAPSAAQIAAVVTSLRAHGLTPRSLTPNGLSIPVTATAGAVAGAFGTSLQRVALKTGRTAFLNTRAPLLDSSLTGTVQDVLGLNNLSMPQPLALRTAHPRPRASSHVVTGGPQPCALATQAAQQDGSYTSDQLAAAYRFSSLYGSGDEGAGQTVAIFELEGNFPSDIAAFEQCYGISAPVSYTQVDGGPPPPSAQNLDGLETELDVEQVVGLAPRASVIVYQGPYYTQATNASVYDTYAAIIDQDRAKVISTSWGICEAQEQSGGAPNAGAENTLFEEAAIQGQSIFSAAGDKGSQDCADQNGNPLPGLAVDDPSSQPFVTGVGGTTLSAIGPPPVESVWNDPATANGVCGAFTPCGGGGGISALWQMPSYQSDAPGSLHVINQYSSGSPCGAPAGTYCREVPDVSADADPGTGVTVYWANHWGGIGGTSIAAPLWAALTADINAYSACNGIPIGFANPVLYEVAAAHAYASDFNDITTGNNDITGTNNGLYPAGPGYDMASGLGTPNAGGLATTICQPTVALANPGPQRTQLRAHVNLQIVASDSDGYPLSYRATGLPAGLSIGTSTGAITGTTTRSGSYAVTITAVDSRLKATSASFRWTVYTPGPPTGSHVSLAGVGNGRPRLSFSLAAGRNAPLLTRLVVYLPASLSVTHRGRISLSGAAGRIIRAAHRLTITLNRPASRLRLLIGGPAITAGSALVGRVRSGRRPKLTITLRVIDSSGHASTVKLRVRAG